MMSKEKIAATISETEKLAFSTLEPELKWESEKMRKEALSKDHLIKMIIDYQKRTIQEYNKLSNYYKSAWEEGYDRIIFESKSTSNKEDRIDFIATMLFGMYENKENATMKERFDFLGQMRNLEDIVHETYSLKIKSTAYSQWLKDKSEKKITTDPIPSFQWLPKNSLIGLDTLYDGLQGRYIECGKKAFKNLFTHKNEYKRVKWEGKSSELVYLYWLLLDNDLIENYKKEASWKTLRSCFEYNKVDEAGLKTRYKTQTNIEKIGVSNKPFFDRLIKGIVREISPNH